MPSGYDKTLPEIVPLFPANLTHAIRINGDVYDLARGGIVDKYKQDDGHWYVKLPGSTFFIDQAWVQIKVSVLMGLAYKSPFVELEDVLRLDMFHYDDNADNVHPSNLIWKYPAEGLACKHKSGFYYIPGYSRAVIDKEGSVFSLHLRREIPINVDRAGYRCLTLKADSGIRTFAYLSRLLCLTFVPYDKSVWYLEANHMDLNKLNNRLSNLEWLTHNENLKHARLMLGRECVSHQEAAEFEKRYGVNPRQLWDASVPERDKARLDWRIENREKYKQKYTMPGARAEPVQRKDLLTGEITEYATYEQAGASIGCGAANIGYAVKKSTPHFAGEDGRYLFKKKSDDWFDVSYADKPAKAGKSKKVISTDAETGEIKEYPSAVAFYTENALPKSAVEYALLKGKNLTLNGLSFRYKT